MAEHTNSAGIPLPKDLRSGPVVVGVDAAEYCGRPIRAAVFLARCLDRQVLLIHVRRRVMPLVEGFVPMQEDMAMSEASEKAMEAELADALVASGDLTDVEWELVSTYGEAATEIIRIAHDRDAACVVVGKKHTGFAELLHRIASGSVSRAVVASQKFPVMVVP